MLELHDQETNILSGGSLSECRAHILVKGSRLWR